MSKSLAVNVQSWLEQDAAVVSVSEPALANDVQAVVTAISAQAMHVVWVDRAPIHTKTELLESLYCALQLPSWFGFNYDALQDALEMLELVEGQPWVLVFRQFDVLQENDSECAGIFIEICRQVISMNDSALVKLILL